MIRNLVRLILGLALAIAAGCDTQDTERLARVGRLTLDKVQTLAEDNAKAFSDLQPARQAGKDEQTLDARVAARLHWEKSLADAKIEVSVKDGKVELRGKVGDPAQRRRAVELAESTVGADIVVDLLEAPEP